MLVIPSPQNEKTARVAWGGRGAYNPASTLNRSTTRMCWADKLGLLWAFAVYFGLFVIANDKTALISWYFSFEGLKLLLIIVLPVWVALRLIDWILGGPARRRGIIKARVIHY